MIPMICFQEVAKRSVCMQGRDNEETELEFEEDLITGSHIQHFRRQVNAQTYKSKTSSKVP